MKDKEEHFFLGDVPAPPPRNAKTFRKVGKWCLIAIAFLAPFFFLPATEDPVGINKLFVVGLLAIAAFICFLGCALEERRIEYPRSWLALAIVLFLAIQGISAWLSIVPAQSVWGGLSAPDSLVSYLVYTLIFFLSFYFFRREDIGRIGLAIGGGLFVATILAVFGGFGISILPWQFAKTASFNADGTDAGWGILLATVIAALMVVRPGELAGKEKAIFFSIAAIALVGLVVLNYQLLWLALAAFIIIVAALRFGPREHFQYAFAIIVLALFFALVSSRLPGFSGIPQDLRPGVAATATAAQGTLKGHAILVGSGPATFVLDFKAYRPVSVNQTSFWAQSFSQGHDFIMTLLATGGLLGILLFLAIMLLAIQPFLHLQSLDTDLAVVASASAFLLAALFLYPTVFSGMVILFALLGLLVPEKARGALSFNELSNKKSFIVSLFILALAAVSLAGVFVAGEQYAAAILFSESNTLASAGDLSQAFAKVNTAITLTDSDEYLRSASQILLSETRALAASSDPATSAELPAAISNTVDTAQSAVLQDPNDPANWGNLGTIYEAVMPVAGGADQLAEGSYQNASRLDPQDPEWDVDMARVLMESAGLLTANATNQPTIQADWDSAESLLQQAISLKDDYADPRVLLVQLYLQEGNVAQAIQRVQELKQQNPLDPGVAFELGYLYYLSNQTDSAQEEFQMATLLSPSYANAHYFLGLIYDSKGMEPQALDQFDQIESSNPGNAQIQNIIANLEAGRPALTGVVSPALSGQPAVTPVQSNATTTEKTK